MAGWHGAPGGLVGAPVSLLHPLLYIDPSPRLPPLPLSLFKRYFHSWRVLYRQLKLIIYTGVCWIGGGQTQKVGGKGPPTAVDALSPQGCMEGGDKGGRDGDTGC